MAGLILVKDGQHVLFADATAAKVLPPAALGQVGFGSVDPAGLHHGLVKGEVFKGVERVVVNKHTDGALRRQVVRGVMNDLFQGLAAIGSHRGAGANLRTPGSP